MRGRCFPSGRRAFAELVPDSPGRYVQQPRLEGTPGRIVGELGQLARHGDDRFLHDVVGLRLGAAGLEGEAPNQVPITVIEFGAKVRVRAVIDGVTRWQLRDISSGTGYASSRPRAHFGLG